MLCSGCDVGGSGGVRCYVVVVLWEVAVVGEVM